VEHLFICPRKRAQMKIDHNRNTGVTLELFKTLVRLGVVDSIVNPAEWTKWYGVVRRFGRKYGQ